MNLDLCSKTTDSPKIRFNTLKLTRSNIKSGRTNYVDKKYVKTKYKAYSRKCLFKSISFAQSFQIRSSDRVVFEKLSPLHYVGPPHVVSQNTICCRESVNKFLKNSKKLNFFGV